jgi:hypothetical protein
MNRLVRAVLLTSLPVWGITIAACAGEEVSHPRAATPESLTAPATEVTAPTSVPAATPAATITGTPATGESDRFASPDDSGGNSSGNPGDESPADSGGEFKDDSSADSGGEATSPISRQLIVPRENYDTSRSFAELIKLHFLARSSQGELIEAEGNPDLIVETDGKIRVRMILDGREAFVDLLALESELIGEHPVHKVLRLQDMGVPLAGNLAQRLRPESFSEELFHTVTFEYLKDRETSGVIAEVFPDGTLLVISPAVPPEWRSDAEVRVNPLDTLPGTRVRFMPVGESGFRVDATPDHNLDADLGPELSLHDGGSAPPDDGFSRVELETDFPFLGAEYGTIFVGSDGHITLGIGDGSSVTRDAARHLGGPPRLSPLLTDLNPACAGSVHSNVRPGRVAVTWNRVAHLQRGNQSGCGPGTPTNTIQVILYSDGTIEYLYGELDLEFFTQPGGNREAVIGISGGNAPGQPGEIDLSRDLPLEARGGTIFEEFRPGPGVTSGGPVVSPTHFHVNPRAMTARHSSLAREFEKGILSLPFEEQRYPTSALAGQECAVHQESRQDAEYTRLLAAVGYKFNLAESTLHRKGNPVSFGEKLSALLRPEAGDRVRYFGYDQYWLAEILAGLGVSWLDECDTAGSLRRYRLRDGDRDEYYLTVRRSLEPDRSQRYQVVKLDDHGGARAIYTAPGVMLMALPLPWDDNYWMISAEGWPGPEEGRPADPRWQSVYIVNINSPEEYQEVEYPISRYPRAPREGLYGGSAALSADSRFLFNTLYGFTDEGGGLWVTDLTDEEFPANPERFNRIVEWDHLLSWFILEEETDGPSPSRSIFATGKEVAEDFAMTANLLRIDNAGSDSALESKERLLQMVGWNPVPFAWQTLSEQRFMVAVETHFNYENSLLPRALGVYIVPVDTTRSR